MRLHIPAITMMVSIILPTPSIALPSSQNTSHPIRHPTPSPSLSPLPYQKQRQHHQQEYRKQTCPTGDPNIPRTFMLRSIAYVRYETSNPQPGGPQPLTNSTQLVFELINETTGVSTGCAVQEVITTSATIDHHHRRDGQINNNNNNDDNNWYRCLDRVIDNDDDDDDEGSETKTKTETETDSAVNIETRVHVDWADWRQLTVDQSWVCDDSVKTNQFSSLTLTPTCTEDRTGSQYVKQCTAPDMVVSATSQNSVTSQ